MSNLDEKSSISQDEIGELDRFWRACNYLAAGMIYLQDNALLRSPLKPEHIKQRLLGHWGSSPGQSFAYIHLSRLIKKYSISTIFISGPGHGAPGVIAPVYLEGAYSQMYPDCSESLEGLNQLFRKFSFPGGVGSHCTPELPGSIHEGGELGYGLSHAFGAAFDNPDLLVCVMIGDGEAETGPLAAAWHSNKFLNPVVDGTVLPILHLNGYKINNPTILSRIPRSELENLLKGYGWTPYFVEGDDPHSMHQQMADALENCWTQINSIKNGARSSHLPQRGHWPMIVLRSPKGWTGPELVDGHQVLGTWRAHQVPLGNVIENPEHLSLLEKWLKSYKTEELFDANGQLLGSLKNMMPQGSLRMSMNPHANGGVLRTPLNLPECQNYETIFSAPASTYSENTRPLGKFLRDTLRANPTNFRIFGPDETSSNKLDDVYEVTQKTWLADVVPTDQDGGNLSPSGRVMEILSEHTLEGWLEAYLLTGRHGFFSTYEAFSHIISSMFNQYAKWLEVSKQVPWRKPISSLNLLLSSTVWRQDHNGFSHQDPGFLDVVLNKSPSVTRVFFPPDANSLLAVSNYCLSSTNHINVIVCDKQKHLQYLSMSEAESHFQKGIDIWNWASQFPEEEPDIVMVGCGDVATKEALAATHLLREYLPKLKLRFVNVIDLYKLTSSKDHAYGLSSEAFDQIFTKDKPVIFSFHGYPWLIHRLCFRHTNHQHFHVRGYIEMGSINTPLELAIKNKADRFSLAMAAIENLTHLKIPGSIRQQLIDRQQECVQYAHQYGVDLPEEDQWTWL